MAVVAAAHLTLDSCYFALSTQIFEVAVENMCRIVDVTHKLSGRLVRTCVVQLPFTEPYVTRCALKSKLHPRIIIVADYLHTWICCIYGLTKSKRATISYHCQIAIWGCFSAEIRYFRATVRHMTHIHLPRRTFLLRVPWLYYSQANSAYFTSHVQENSLYEARGPQSYMDRLYKWFDNYEVIPVQWRVAQQPWRLGSWLVPKPCGQIQRLEQPWEMFPAQTL